MAQIRWHKRAAQELDEKLEYAREMFGSATVKRWMKELKDTEKRLSVMPESFTPEPILKDCRRTYRMCQLMNRRFKLIYTSIVKILDDNEVKEIDVLGQVFDPNTSEAVIVVEDKTKPEGVVLEVLVKGYMYKDKLLRPAMVKVNK